MFRSLILYLALLASFFTFTNAQSCETSGTYDTCCKTPSTSSDGKVLSFQGSEFRVHCNKVIIPENAIAASTVPACAKICKDDQNCVVAHWTSAGCEKKLLIPQASAIALVPIDSAYQAKAKRDLKNCQDQLTKCQTDLKGCTGNDKSCCKDLKICQDAAGKKDGDCKTCIADKDKCHKDKATCETAKGQCEKDKNKCNTDKANCDKDKNKCITDKGNCNKANGKCNKDKKAISDKNKKCQGDLKKCRGKKKTAGPFKCSNGKREKIGGVMFLHRCDQVARPKQWDMVKNPIPAKDARECAAMCAKQGCGFILQVHGSCRIYSIGWRSDLTYTEKAGNGYTLLQRV